MRPTVLRAALVLGLVVASVAAAADVLRWPPEAAERYEQARQLMQQGKYVEASATYRSVADWPAGGDFPERAQALFASGLMEASARDYERALATYHEVVRRFPGSDFARRAEVEARELEQGGAVQAMVVQRKLDAARDELFPAQERAEREGLRAGRPGLERAVQLLQEILRDHGDHPKARDAAVALGDAQMTLLAHRAARDAYQRALELAGDDRHAVTVARQKLDDAVVHVRRDTARGIAWGLLAAVAVGLLAVRPWRGFEPATLRLGGQLALATIVLALIAAGANWFIRVYVDDHSPVEGGVAALLVLLPGITGQVVTLGFASGLAGARRARAPRWITGVAVVAGAVAAFSVAVWVVHAYELFPLLDSEF